MADDAFSLERFVSAQRQQYQLVLGELHAGNKRSHWMWFIFPQIAGLGFSELSLLYGIAGIPEARAYLAHEYLGPRLAECTDAMLGWSDKRGADRILGQIDAMKFRSSMTLFEAAGGGERFTRALELFFSGNRDERTLALLASAPSQDQPS
jgi:uncharacterized protein (DUF1810 family)